MSPLPVDGQAKVGRISINLTYGVLLGRCVVSAQKILDGIVFSLFLSSNYKIALEREVISVHSTL